MEKQHFTESQAFENLQISAEVAAEVVESLGYPPTEDRVDITRRLLLLSSLVSDLRTSGARREGHSRGFWGGIVTGAALSLIVAWAASWGR